MAEKLTQEQKDMFDDLSPLQQKICTNILSGMSNIDAYIAAGGKGKTKASQEAAVSEILSKLKCKEFLDSVKHNAVNSAVMSRQEMLERLSNLARTPLSDLIEWGSQSITGEEGIIEQSVWRLKASAFLDDEKMATIAELAATKDGFKIKQHSPLAAMKQLADLEGYNKPTKTEVKAEVKAEVTVIDEETQKAIGKYLDDDC